ASYLIQTILSSSILLSFKCYLAHRYLHSFPTRRSSDLIRTIQENDIQHGDIQFVITAGEESGLVGAKALKPEHIHASYGYAWIRSEEHTSELQSRFDLVCRLLLEKKKTNIT